MIKLLRKITILAFAAIITISNINAQVYADTAYPKEPDISVGGAILMDADTGAILYEKEAYNQFYPASITKIMTCLLAVENLALDDTITFSNEVFETLPWDAALLGVKRGETLTVKDCLYGLMLRSGNEVAVALALEMAGSEEAFGEMMTARAKEAGALNTVFTNASGLYQDTHITTPYDMAVITREAIKNGTFAEVWGEDYYTMSATNMSESYEISNRHKMLLSSSDLYYEYAKGGKTGYEDLAKRTLVTHAKKDGISLICVVMFGENDKYYGDTEELLNYGFTNFKKVRVVDEENRFGKADGFIGISDTDYITIPANMQVSELGYELNYAEDTTGGNIATIKYYHGTHYMGESRLTFSGNENGDSGIVKPVETKKEPEESLYIDVGYIVAAVIVLATLVIFTIYMVKTKQKRKIKRDRKRLFKEEGRKYKIKKRRRN